MAKGASKQQIVVQKGTKKQVKKAQAKKEKVQEEEAETANQESKIESQSKEQIEQLNKHLGAIEGKVSEITKKYEELKKSDESKD